MILAKNGARTIWKVLKSSEKNKPTSFFLGSWGNGERVSRENGSNNKDVLERKAKAEKGVHLCANAMAGSGGRFCNCT